MNNYNSKAIANTFLELGETSNKYIYHSHLQYLIFITNGWHLALFNTSLISEDILAWKCGPIIKNIYYEFKQFDKSPILLKACEINFDNKTLTINKIIPSVLKTDNFVYPLILKIWDLYKNYTINELTKIIQQKNSPWKQVIESERVGATIPNELIKKYYISLIDLGFS